MSANIDLKAELDWCIAEGCSGPRTHAALKAARAALAAAPAATQEVPTDAQPVFWYRPCRDGLYEGPVHNNSVGGKMLRDERPTEWHPLYAAPQPAAQPYSIDSDPAGIRARVADAITGALAFGAQGVNPAPAGHWLEPFWCTAWADTQANATATHPHPSGDSGQVAGGHQDAIDAARWRYIRRKLCLNGNGNGTCSMHAINLPASINGWPEPGAVEEFCGAAIDAARAQQDGGA